MKQESIKELFDRQRHSLDYFFDHVNLSDAERLVESIRMATGIVFFTGVGKSGFVAQKISATLVSIGIKSMFLSPINALHGDLGIVNQDDLFIFLSKSGETDELLNLVPFLRNKRAGMIALVSKKNSRLAKACDREVYIPLEKELCPYNIIPTTSPELQLIFGDIIAVALMQEKKLTLDEFVHNHPAGKIGQNLSLKVEDLMLQNEMLPVCYPHQKLSDTLEVFTEKRCGCLLVIDNEHHLMGIFTDGDLRRALQAHGPQILDFEIKDLKKAVPKVILPQKMAWEAMQLMEADQKRPFMVLPVVDEAMHLKGLIKMHDILQSGLR